MEVTATALLCLNTSSRLSCREQRHTASDSLTNQLTLTTVFLYILLANFLILYLRLREHVKAPGAHFTVSGNADQVVSVLGSHHAHTVDWVLNTIEHS